MDTLEFRHRRTGIPPSGTVGLSRPGKLTNDDPVRGTGKLTTDDTVRGTTKHPVRVTVWRCLLLFVLGTLGTASLEAQSDRIPNGGFTSGTNWTYFETDASAKMSGAIAAGGNPGDSGQLTFNSTTAVSAWGIWQTSFTLTAIPSAATLSFDWKYIAENDLGANNNTFNLRVYIDTASGATLTNQVWSLNLDPLTNNPGGWTPVAAFDVSSIVTSATTYYVKVVYEANTGRNWNNTVGYDNVACVVTDAPNMDLTTVTATQLTDDIGYMSGKGPISKFRFTTTGSNSPTQVSQIVFTANNTSDADVQAVNGVQLYYTTADSLDMTAAPLATANIGATIVFPGLSQNLAAGSGNFFWVVYIPRTTATYGSDFNCRIAAASDITVSNDATPGIATFSGGDGSSHREIRIFFDQFDYRGTAHDTTAWTTNSGIEVLPDGAAEPSAPNSVRFNDTDADAFTYASLAMNLTTYSAATVAYQFEQDATNPPEAGDELFMEYLNESSVWTLGKTHNLGGTEPGTSGSFTPASFNIPAASLWTGFRIRFRSSVSLGTTDMWYVDDVKITGIPLLPRNLDSIGITQASTDPVVKSTTNNAVLRVQFTVSEMLGTLTLGSITIANAGNESDANVSPVKVWYTTSSTFSATEQLGANGTFSGGAVTITPLSGKQLPTGSSYIWISFDVASGATTDATADARITALTCTAAGGANDPQPTVDAALPADPTGSRRISPSLKKWNGGGWNQRQINGTGGYAAGTTIQLRLDTVSSPTANEIYSEAQGSTFASKAESVRIFREAGGSWSEIDKDVLALTAKKAYINFQLPVGHAAGDSYYLATGGASPTSAATYSSLAWTVVDDFEDGNLTSSPAWSGVDAGTSAANDISMRSGTYAMKLNDTDTGSDQTTTTSMSLPSRALIRFWARASANGLRLHGLSSGSFNCWIEDVDSQIPGFTSNTWYDIQIDANETSYVFDTYVDGSLYREGAAYVTNNATATLYVETGGWGNSVVLAYVDNVRFATLSATQSAGITLASSTAGNGLWSSAVNWTPAGIPGASDDVLIAGTGFTYQPAAASSASCRYLQVASGNALAVSGGTFSIADDLSLSGTLNHTGGTIRFASAQNASIAGPASLTLGNVEIIAGGNSLDVGSTALTVTGTLTLTSGTLNLGTGTHSLQGDLSQTAGSIAATAYTLQATGSADQSWTGSPLSLLNLTVDKTAGTVTLSTGLTISDRLTLPVTNAGNLDLGGGTHALNGTDDALSFVVNGGRLDISTSTTTASAKLNVGVGGTVRMNGGGFLKLPAAGADVSGTFRAAVTGSGRPTLTKAGGSPYAFTFQDNATVDLYGLNVEYPNPSGIRILDQDGSGIVRIDDVSFTFGAGDALHFQELNSGSYTLRLCAFDGSYSPTVRLRSGTTGGTPNLAPASTAQIRMENASGDRGDNLSATGGGIAEDFDGDPDGDLHITWVYFKRWLGTENTTWSVGGNWEGGTSPDQNANSGAGEDVLIAVADNSPILDQNWRVRSFSIASGATFSLGTYTLTITGDNFQAFGGTFVPGTGTVSVTGTIVQVINVGTNPLYNFMINKLGGTANLATNLTIQNDLRILDGTFDLKGYSLTVQGRIYVDDERPGYASDATDPAPAESETPVPDGDGSIVAGTTSTLTSVGVVRVRGGGSSRGTVTFSGSAVWTAQANVNPADGTNDALDAGKIKIEGGRFAMGDGSGTDVLRIPSGGILELVGSGRLEMRTTGTAAQATIAGTLLTSMSGAIKPTITSANGSNGYVFTVSGTVDVSGLKFSRADDNGLDITSTATLTRLNSMEFRNGSPNAGARHLRVVRAVNGSFLSEGCTFDNGTSPPYYVTLDDGALTFTLYMSNATGAGTGLNDTNIGTREEQLNGATITWVDRRTWVGNWQYRQPVTITNADGSSPLVAGATVEVLFNHGALVPAKSLANGNDVRIVYWNSTTSVGQELDRVLVRLNNNDNWGNGDTRIAFRTVAQIGIGGNSDVGGQPTYFIYYGNSSAGAPPTDAASAGVAFFDGFESGDFASGGWTLSDATINVSGAAGKFYDGANGANLDANSSPQSITRGGISTIGFPNVYAIFAWRRVNSTGTSGEYVAFQADTGSGYADVGTTISATTAWTLVAPRLIPNGAGLSSLNIRFEHALSLTSEEGGVDSVRLYANQNGALATSVVGAEQPTASQWADPFNWSPVGVPGTNTAVTIDEATVAYQYPPNQNTGSSQTVLSLTIGDVTSGGLTLTNPLVVTRDVTIDTAGAQTAVTLNANLTVGGDVVYAEGTFAGAQSVLFNRGSTQDQHIRGTAASITFPANVDTVAASAAKVLVDINTTVSGGMTVVAGTEVEVSAGATLQPAGAVSVAGILDIEPNGTLSLGNAATVAVSGTFEAIGTGTGETGLAKITSTDTSKANGGYAFEVTGTTKAQYYRFYYMGVNGVKISGPVDATYNLADGFFDNLVDSGTLLSFASYSGAALSIPRVDFKDSAPPAAGTWGTTKYNVRASTTTAINITFTTPTGAALGEDKDKDEAGPPSNVVWPSLVTPELTSATADDNSGGGAGIQVGDRVILLFDNTTNAYTITAANIDTVLDLSNSHTWGTIQSAVWSANGATANAKLTISLGTGADVAINDTITLVAGYIQDASNTNNATDAPVSPIGGNFGADSPALISCQGAEGGASESGAGPGDTVTLIWDKKCRLNTLSSLTPANVDAILALSGAHSWGAITSLEVKDGGASIAMHSGASWAPGDPSTTNWDRLVITLNTGATVRIGDSINVASGSLMDQTKTNTAGGSPPGIGGTFGPPTIESAVASDPAPSSAGIDAGDLVRIVFNNPTNQPALTDAQVKSILLLTGSSPASPTWGTASPNVSATWTDSRTLEITFSNVTGASIGPFADSGDTQVNVAGAQTTIKDSVGLNNAASGAVAIAGTFGGAPLPTLQSAIAEDFSGSGPGVQQNDRVVFTFDFATDIETITAAEIAAQIPLSVESAWGTLSPSPPGVEPAVRWDVTGKVLIVYLAAGADLTVGTTQFLETDATGRNKHIESTSGSDGNAGYDPQKASLGWNKTLAGTFGLGWAIRVRDVTGGSLLQGVRVRLMRNTTDMGVGISNADGTVNFGDITTSDVLLAYRDNDGGAHADDTYAVTEAKSAGAAIAAGLEGEITIYLSTLSIGPTSASALSGANLNTLRLATPGGPDSDVNFTTALVGGGIYSVTLDSNMNLRVAGDFTPGDDGTNQSVMALQGTADLTVSSGTYTVARGADRLTWSGGSGNLTVSGGTLQFGDVAATPTSVTVPGTTTLSGGTLSLGTGSGTRTITCTGSFTKSAGTNAIVLDEPEETLDLNGSATWSGGTVSISDGTITCAGNWDDSTGSGAFVPSGGTVNFDGAGTIKQRSAATRNKFFSLAVSSGARSIAATDANSDGTLDIDGNVTLTGGSFAPGTYTHTVAGNWDDSVASGAFAPAAGTIQFDGTGSIKSRSAATRNEFFSVTISAGTRSIAATDGNSDGSLDIDGNFTLSGGTFAPGTYTHTVAGNWDDSAASAGFTPAAGTIKFDGAGSIKSRSAAARNEFFNMEAASGARTIAATDANSDGTLSLDGSLTISGGSLDLSTYAHTVAANFVQSGGTFTTGAGGSLTVTGTYTMSGGSESFSASAVINCSGDVSITTAVASGCTPPIGHTFNLLGDASGTGNLQGITMGGDANNTFGTLVCYVDTGSSAKTVRLLSAAKAGKLQVGHGSSAVKDVTFDPNGFSLTLSSTANVGGPAALRCTGTSATKRGILLLDDATSSIVDPGGSEILQDAVLSMSDGDLSVEKDWRDNTGTCTPTGGTITLNGAAGQTILTASGNNFFNLAISNAGTTQFAVGSDLVLDVNGTLAVSGGTLDLYDGATAAAMDVEGSVTVSGGATLDPRTLTTHTVGGAWDDSGGTFAPTAGTVTFDAATIGTYALKQGATNNFYNLIIATSGTDRIIRAAATSAAIDVNGAFTMTGGAYDPNGIGLEVFGNCDISAGDFTPDAAMTTTLNGSAPQTVTGTAGNHFWDLTIANTGAAGTLIGTSTSFGIRGNYTNSSANATLNATAGTITFSGGADLNDQTLDLQTGGDAAIDRFAGITVANSNSKSAILATSETLNVNGALTVASGGTLQLNASTTVQFVTDAAPVDSLTVQIGGTLKTSGTTSAAKATITRLAGSGTYAFLVNGTLGLDYYRVRYCDANGMQVGAGALDADGLGDGNFDGLGNGDFDFPVAGTALLNFTGYDGPTPAGVYGCRFSNSGGVASAKGVKGTTVGAAGILTFFGWSGAIGGPEFEIDTSNKVAWTTTIYSIMSGVTIVDNYAGVAAALANATAVNNIVDSRGSGIEDLLGATIAFPDQTGVMLRNAFLKNGSIEGSGGAAGNRGTLRNCFIVFTAGTQTIGDDLVPGDGLKPLDFVQNCTVVDKTSTAGTKITVKGAGNGVENTILIGSSLGAPTPIVAANGASEFTNKTTAADGITSAIFVDAERYDYHLKDTAAAAINAGTNLNAGHGAHAAHGFASDIDDGARPVGAAWDVGADEYGAVLVGGSPGSIPSWSTVSAPGGDLMGKILSPPTFFFSTGLLYAGTTSGGASLNSSMVLINPSNGAVARSFDLAAALEVVNAHPLTQPGIFRNSSGTPTQDFVAVSVDTNNPADGIPDKFVCLLDIEFRTGTVSVTNTSAVVTGTSTTWQTSSPQVLAGDRFVGPDNVTYTVLTRDSDTQITLTAPYGGATIAGASYRIGRLALYTGFSANGVLDSSDGANALYQPVGQPTFSSDGTDNFLWIPAATSGGGTVYFCKYTLAGVRAWANSTHAADFRAPSFFNKTMNKCYIALTNDGGGWDWGSVARDGTGALQGSNGSATVNRFPAIWVTPGSSTSWLFLAPETNNSYAVQGATGTSAWVSPDINGTPTTACINPTFFNWVYVGVSEHICKINRATGALATDGDAAGEDWSTTDWLKGPISSNYVTLGGKMMFGTERGYCYQISMVNDEATSDGQNGVVNGFPYRVPGGRIMGCILSTLGGNRIYFVTDDGRIVSFLVQP